MRVLVLVGTGKGAFILESDERRRDWRLRGPFCAAQPINHVIADPDDQAIFAAGGNSWTGPAVWRSDDLGASWQRSSDGLAHDAPEGPVQTIWALAARHGRVFAGAQPAALFVSDDRGASWRHLSGLQEHPTRAEWSPGGAGLILHAIVPHPEDERQIWLGISAVGVFHSGDGGASFQPRNRGTRQDYAPEGQRYPELGQCVHAIAMAAGMPERLYQQGHCGMYRSDDGGRQWQSIEAGLPSSFGFPAVAHPRDPDTLYLVPTQWRRRRDATCPMPKRRSGARADAGQSWQALRTGLPQENVFFHGATTGDGQRQA